MRTDCSYRKVPSSAMACPPTCVSTSPDRSTYNGLANDKNTNVLLSRHHPAVTKGYSSSV